MGRRRLLVVLLLHPSEKEEEVAMNVGGIFHVRFLFGGNG